MAKATAIEILDKFGDKHFDVEELVRSLEEAPGPYQNVSLVFFSCFAAFTPVRFAHIEYPFRSFYVGVYTRDGSNECASQ